MKIRNYIFVASMLALSSVYGQNNKNVGINTENPSRTLDVNGTVAVSDLPLKEEGALPLGLASDDNQVMKAFASDGVGKPFRIVDYHITVKTPSEDWVNAIDLKIPTDKYTLFLMSSSLLDNSDLDKYHNGSSVFLNILGVGELSKSDHRPELYVGQYTERGRAEVIQKSETASDPYSGLVGVGARQVYLYPYSATKTWKLYADYPSSRGVNFEYTDDTREKVVNHKSALKYDATYTWRVRVLIVDNNWIARKDVSLDLKSGSDSEPANSVTVLP